MVADTINKGINDTTEIVKDTIIETAKIVTDTTVSIFQDTITETNKIVNKAQTANNELLIVVILLFILLLSLIVNVIFYMKDNRNKKKKVVKTEEINKNISQTNENGQDKIRQYTDVSNDNMFYLGMSLQGKSHLGKNIPCQDFHKIEILEEKNNIGIAVVSDGAGSVQKSEEGSQIVCENAVEYLKMAIIRFNWLDTNNLPNEETWDKIIREIIRLIQIDLAKKAKEQNCELKSYAATFLILFFTPKKSFFAHVGDGRAGVKTDGIWEAILTPHKGEEADQTVFLTDEILTPDDLKISGVSVPETKIINAPIEAFILMSDGCENGMWHKDKRIDKSDGDFQYIPVNQPFVPAIDKLFEFIKNSEDKENLLYQFLEKYNKSLQAETDDKTVVFGFPKYH
jgi:hypothetical protein